MTLPALILLAGCGAQIAFDCDSGSPFCDVAEVYSEDLPPAREVDIVGVGFYQGVETQLLDGGTESLQGPVPFIAGRDALVRILIAHGDAWVDRPIVGRVYTTQGDTAVGAAQAELDTSGESSWTSLSSTLNVHLSGAFLPEGDVGLRVEVVEAEAGVMADGEEGSWAWPSEGSATLKMESVGDSVRLAIVPIRYNADDSGRLPDTSDMQVAMIQTYMKAYYPTPAVEVRVTEVVDTDQRIDPMGTGWSETLTYIADSRARLGIEDDEYIYGAFSPANDLGTFCAGGCILGLSSVSTMATDAYNRASIGIGYTGVDTALTLVHEVGHAHGRLHSPGCGAQGAYDGYPNSEGKLDVRGYNPILDALQETSSTFDFMSYCPPYWTSAFTYNPLAVRIREVNAAYADARIQKVPWRTLWVHSDGHLAWGADRPLWGEPVGDLRTVTLLGDKGQVVGQVQAVFTPFSSLPGGSLVFPDPGYPFQGARYEGQEIR